MMLTGGMLAMFVAPPQIQRLALHHRCVAPQLLEGLGKVAKLEKLRTELAVAVQSESYDDAARLRDEMATLALDEEVAVLSVNTEFYSSFSAGDLEAMGGLWGLDDIACAHPGYPMLVGREAVMKCVKSSQSSLPNRCHSIALRQSELPQHLRSRVA